MHFTLDECSPMNPRYKCQSMQVISTKVSACNFCVRHCKIMGVTQVCTGNYFPLPCSLQKFVFKSFFAGILMRFYAHLSSWSLVLIARKHARLRSGYARSMSGKMHMFARTNMKNSPSFNCGAEAFPTQQE